MLSQVSARGAGHSQTHGGPLRTTVARTSVVAGVCCVMASSVVDVDVHYDFLPPADDASDGEEGEIAPQVKDGEGDSDEDMLLHDSDSYGDDDGDDVDDE